MKSSRSEIHRETLALSTVRFEDQQLTSFSGLIIFKKPLDILELKNRLRHCFKHLSINPIFGRANIVLLLILHLLLSYRKLHHLRYKDGKEHRYWITMLFKSNSMAYN